VLRVVPSRNATSSKEYFTTGLSREDYYTGEGRAGTWFGAGATRLGLAGDVARKDFASLCDNVKPGTDARLTPRTKANRRVAYDFNFHVPKSVSILYGLEYDDRILSVFHESVRYAMTELERAACTRVRVNAADDDRCTENLVWAEFTHFTARPVKGVSDPHLHAHCFVFNITFDEVERRWKACQFGPLMAELPYYEAKYMGKFAEGLRQLGYELRPKGKYWEIEGAASSVEKFSARSAEINRFVEERGITNAVEKSRVGAKTRKAKTEGGSLEATRKSWRERLTPQEKSAFETITKSAPRGKELRYAKLAVEYAIDHAFARTAVVPHRLFMALALPQAFGRVTESDIEKEMERAGVILRVLDGQQFVTSKAVLEEENRMLELAKKGRGKYDKLRSNLETDARLTADQSKAVKHAFDSRDFVTIIEGRSGTGKTTLLSQLRRELNAASTPVSQHYLSPTTKGRDRLIEEKFHGAQTVAGFLADPKKGSMSNVGVVVLDEAGLLGTNALLSVMEYCWKAGHRLVLVGDSRQNTAQSRGSPLRSLREHAGVGTAWVEEVVRQRGQLKAVATALGEGRILDGVHQLEEMGRIRVEKEHLVPYAAASEYAATFGTEIRAMLVTPSRQERETIEPVVRSFLTDQKALGKARQFDALVQRELTDLDKAKPETYAKGDVVQFVQNTKRALFMPKGSHFRAGTRWEVLGHDPLGHVLVKRVQSLDPFGRVKVRESFPVQHLPLSKSDHFLVFTKQSTEVCIGELIRVMHNGFTHSVFDQVVQEGMGLKKLPKRKLVNGSEHRVKRFTRAGDMQLENGLIVRRDFGHFEYGYCTSAVKAQGASVDKAILVQTGASGRAANARQFYVSATRGASDVVIFTDDKTRLFTQAQQEQKDWTATDLMRGEAPPTLTQQIVSREAEQNKRPREALKQDRGLER